MYFQVCSNLAYSQQSALRWAMQDQWSSGITIGIPGISLHGEIHSEYVASNSSWQNGIFL